MEFEWFTGGRDTGRALEIQVAPTGSITLSRELSKHFKENSYVQIGYNKEARKLAIKVVKETEQGARKLTTQSHRYQFSAIGFLKLNDLFVTKDGKIDAPKEPLPAEYDEKQKMIIVSLPK